MLLATDPEFPFLPSNFKSIRWTTFSGLVKQVRNFHYKKLSLEPFTKNLFTERIIRIRIQVRHVGKSSLNKKNSFFQTEARQSSQAICYWELA